MDIKSENRFVAIDTAGSHAFLLSWTCESATQLLKE